MGQMAKHVVSETRRRYAALVVAGLGAWLAFMVAPSVSDAYVYWPAYEYSEYEGEIGGLIGRANPNGSGENLEQVHSGGKHATELMALGESHLYWFSGRNLSRSALNGTEVELNFIENLLTEEEASDLGLGGGLAVAGEYVYWFSKSNAQTIRRAKLNGTEVNRSFLTGLGVTGGGAEEAEGGLVGLATSGSYLYRSSNSNPLAPKVSSSASGPVIGRATLAGGEVKKNFVTGFNFKCEECSAWIHYNGLSLDSLAANGEYLYVLTAPFHEKAIQRKAGIARVKITGGTPELNFFEGFGENGGHEWEPTTLAATKNYLFWFEWNSISGDTIARANADGSEVHRALMCAHSGSTNYWEPRDMTLVANETSSGAGGPSPECALHELTPVLRLDSQETYEPVDMESIIYNYNWEEEGDFTNTLHYDGGTKEVTSDPSISPVEREEWGETWMSGLWPGFLGAEYYDGVTASEADYIDENDNYAEDSQRLAEWFPQEIYGHIVAAPEGKHWLQYWIFYYYDESEYLGLGIGSHEGDWELVQILVNEANEPEEIALSQHESGAKCEWGAVEKQGLDRPVVFVAVGTHANYPYAGSWETPAELPFGTDSADGEGSVVEPTVETLGGANRWVSWPGHWGGTFPEHGIEGEGTSPPGPIQHLAWHEPTEWAEGLGGCEERWEGSSRASREAPETAGQVGGKADNPDGPEPTLEAAKYWHDHVWIKYSATDVSPTDRMIVSIHEEGKSAPLSWTVKHVTSGGWIKAPFRFEHLPKAEVLASIFSRSAGRSEIATLSVG